MTMAMGQVRRKLLAVTEVVLVVFVVVPFLTLGVYRLFPGFESWQTERLPFPFPVFGHVVMMGTSLLLITAHRKALRAYGIDFRNMRGLLDIAATCFLPVVVANGPLGMGLDYRGWPGALMLAGAQICLLVFLGWRLRRKTSPLVLGAAGAVVLLSPQGARMVGPAAGQAIAVFLTYGLFVGFGEEVLHRGYVQSRLNAAFGRPYRFFGVAFGWGALIGAMLFGLTHAGIVSRMLGRSGQVTLPWALWTAFGGLVYAFVREKSGSVLPGALLHGLPQAIAAVAILLLG